MNEQLYHLGTCPVCEQGLLGVRICGDCDTAYVLCDECEALWETPDTTSPAEYLDQPEAPCPQCQCSLVATPSRWAAAEDIEQLEWQDYVEGEYAPHRPESDEPILYDEEEEEDDGDDDEPEF